MLIILLKVSNLLLNKQLEIFLMAIIVFFTLVFGCT